MFVNTDYSEVWLNASDFSLSGRVKIVSNKSRHRGRAAKRQKFFVSDGADGYFVSSPWSAAWRFLLGKIYGNRGLEMNKICTVLATSCVRKVHGLGF